MLLPRLTVTKFLSSYPHSYTNVSLLDRHVPILKTNGAHVTMSKSVFDPGRVQHFPLTLPPYPSPFPPSRFSLRFSTPYHWARWLKKIPLTSIFTVFNSKMNEFWRARADNSKFFMVMNIFVHLNKRIWFSFPLCIRFGAAYQAADSGRWVAPWFWGGEECRIHGCS